MRIQPIDLSARRNAQMGIKMKPIIIDMKDMSDSTEVYESRPNPVLAGFIYLILAMVAAAFIWMYFSKVDIVVKGTGTVAAADEVATVTNQSAGVITERKIEDGQEVKKGDILYTVSHEEQTLQLAALEQQLAECEEKEEMLEAYEEWLENGEEFPEELVDNLYYSEVASRKRLVELGQENTLQTYSGELSAYDAKLNANSEMITYYSDAVTKSKQLIEAIKNRKNSFSKEESYYWNTMENYLVQYQQTINQYDDKISELQKQSDDAAKEIEELEAQKRALQEQQSVKLSEASVSGGDADTGSTLQQEMQSLEAELSAQKAIKESADSSISQYQTQKNSALNAYEKESIASIENGILSYEQNKATYESTRQEYINGEKTLKEQGTEVELGNLVTQEKYNVAGELENCRQSQTQLSAQIEILEQSIENATVKATIDGKVNLVTDLLFRQW